MLLVLEFQPPHRARACGSGLAAHREGSPWLYQVPWTAGLIPTQRLATNSLGFKIRNSRASMAYSVPGLNMHALGMTQTVLASVETTAQKGDSFLLRVHKQK